MYVLLAFLVLFLAYSILLFYYWQSWKTIPVFQPHNPAPVTRITVIIPARNEAANIAALLDALRKQTYPAALTQLIVVDDHSDDATASIVSRYNEVTLLQLQDGIANSYKKKAIETGIAAATGEWIITTDADCLPPPEWLSNIVACKEKNNALFIAAPVVIANGNSVVQVFQAMDFMILQGITGASVYKGIHSMCNGANMAYARKVFYEVDGFKGIDSIASGDDMLLMHKIWVRHRDRVHFLKTKNAIVATQPMTSWRAFFNQRIRWASKAAYYDDKRIFLVLLLVYLFNVFFLVLLIAGCWNSSYWLLLGAAWIAKTVVELPLFISVARFFNKVHTIRLFFLFQPLHIGYTILSGFFGQLGRYEWKGRTVK